MRLPAAPLPRSFPPPRSFPLRRALAALLALALVAALASPARAQSTADPLRVVVVPFDAEGSLAPLGVGMAAALQRALNTVDGVYAPPLGDVVLVTQRALEAELDPLATARRLFDADHVVGGRLTLDGGLLELDLEVDGEARPAAARSSAPPALARAYGEALLDGVLTGLSQSEQNAFLGVLGATPSAPSLGSATLSASLLPGAELSDLEAAAALDSGSSWVRSEFARQLLRAGEVERALEQATAAAELTPADVEAQIVLAVARGAAGDAAGAEAAFARARQLNPVHPLALVGLAQLAGDAGERDELLEAALRANPRLLDAYALLAAGAATPQAALQTLRRGAPYLADSVAYHRTVLDAILEAGDAGGALAYLRDTARQDLAAGAGLYALAERLPPTLADEAAALVAEGRERYPESVDLALSAVRLRLEAGDVDGALALLEPLLAERPGDGRLLNAQAVAYARQGRIEEARAAFERISDPSLTAQLNLGLVYLEAGQPAAARDVLAPLADRGDPRVLAFYGLAQSLSGDVDAGRATLERAAELAPDLELPRRALQQLEQRRAAGVDPEALPEAVATAVDRGLFALDTGEFGAAAAAFADARATADSGALAYLHGLALLRSGDARSAVDAYRTALEGLGAEQEPTVLGNLGFAYLRLGRYDLALDALRSSVELDPSTPQTHVTLGLTYYGLGRYGEALAAFERAVELEPALETQLVQVMDESRRRTP